MPRPPRIRIALGCTAVMWGLGHVAAAAPPDLELDYRGPGECGGPEPIVNRFERYLGDGQAEGWFAQIRVSRASAEHFSVEFLARRGDVESARVLVVDSCDAVVEASALLLLLAVDPVRAAEIAEEEDAGSGSPNEVTPDGAPEPTSSAKSNAGLPSNTADVKASPEPDAMTTSADLGRDLAPSAGWLSAGALWHSGEMASDGFGAGLELGGLWPSASPWGQAGIRLATGWLPVTHRSLSELDESRLATEAYIAELQGLYLFGSDALRLGPAAGIGVRFVEAQAQRITAPAPPGSTAWTSLLFGARAEVQLHEMLGVCGTFDVTMPLNRPRFRVGGLQPFRPEPVGMGARLGIFWRFGSQ